MPPTFLNKYITDLFSGRNDILKSLCKLVVQFYYKPTVDKRENCPFFHSLHSFTSRNGFSKMKKLYNSNRSRKC